MEYGVYGDLFVISPKPFSIYLRGTRGFGLLIGFRIFIAIVEECLRSSCNGGVEKGAFQEPTGPDDRRTVHMGTQESFMGGWFWGLG